MASEQPLDLDAEIRAPTNHKNANNYTHKHHVHKHILKYQHLIQNIVEIKS